MMQMSLCYDNCVFSSGHSQDSCQRADHPVEPDVSSYQPLATLEQGGAQAVVIT